MPADRRQCGAFGETKHQRALPRHGITRVERHIDQRRFKLTAVRADVTGPLRQVDHHLDPRAGHGVQYVADVLDTLTGIKHLRVQRLATGKRQ